MLKASFMRYQTKAIFSCNCLLRLKHSSEGLNLKELEQPSEVNFHQPQAQDYPATKQLPLPLNFEDLSSSERLKFSPQRSRDINGSYISTSTISLFMEFQTDKKIPVDDRIECYDCSGTINLNSAMQTNVPFPYISRVKPIHLNMPGGQWRQKEKYVSEDLNNVHHTNTTKLTFRSGTSLSLGSRTGTKNFYFSFPSRDLNFYSSLLFSFSKLNSTQFRTFCAVRKEIKTVQENVDTKKGTSQLTARQKLQALAKEYGPVVIVLHITISLASLLIIYVVTASGIDLSGIRNTFGASEGAVTAETASHFVLAYAINKMLAPVRIGLTLITAPFVAKKLKKLKLLKRR